MYIDSHCHLNLEQFNNDYKETIERAFASRVKAIINVGANLESSQRAVDLTREFKEGIFATVGMHPTDATHEEFNEKIFLDLLNHPKVIAVGEIGLDYAGGNINKVAQAELLNKQILIASHANKPVVLHCRDAYDDLISILMGMTKIPRGVLHCYVGNWSHAQVFLEMGFYFSFTGIITFAKNHDIEEVIQKLPLKKILIETDAPWLAPEPYRGKRNEPAYVVEVARKIAEIKKIPLEEVETQTTKNTIELFKLTI